MRYFKQQILVVIISALSCLSANAEITVEELFFDDTEMKQRDLLRRMVNMSSDNGSSNVLERVLDRVSKSGSNEEFLEGLHKAANS